MSKISNVSSYSNQSPVEGEDYVIGTAANSAPVELETKTFTMSGISQYVISNIVTPTLQTVTNAGSVTTNDITVGSKITLAEGSFIEDINNNLIIDVPNILTLRSHNLGSFVKLQIDSGGVGFDTGSAVFNSRMYLKSSNLTQNRLIEFPDADGTFALTSDIPSHANFVDLTTNQTINGTKTFIDSIGAAGFKTPTGNDLSVLLDGGGIKLISSFGGGINSVVGGTDITIDNSDPSNPIINASSQIPTNGGYLARITETGKTGYSIADRISANYGDIGTEAIDLSYSTSASTTLGATGDYSLAVGYGVIASGSSSVALVTDATASGDRSVAIGFQAQAIGIDSLAIGRDNVANGHNSVALGKSSTATANNSIAIGHNTSNTSNEGTSMGKFNATTNQLFVIGNGVSGVLSDLLIGQDTGELLAPSLSIIKINAGNDKGLVTKEWVVKGYGAGLSEYADNAAALTGGLIVGNFYRTGDLLKVVH